MTITLVTAPHELPSLHKPSLFLAGGITNCPEWQSEIISLFHQLDVSLTIYNPRRKSFDTSDLSASETQITWEHFYLKNSSAVMFWFSEGSLNPIVMFEYGKELGRGRENIFVGCHTDYLRKFDVMYQTKLERPELEIHSSLNTLAEEIAAWAQSY